MTEKDNTIRVRTSFGAKPPTRLSKNYIIEEHPEEDVKEVDSKKRFSFQGDSKPIASTFRVVKTQKFKDPKSPGDNFKRSRSINSSIKKPKEVTRKSNLPIKEIELDDPNFKKIQQLPIKVNRLQIRPQIRNTTDDSPHKKFNNSQKRNRSHDADPRERRSHQEKHSSKNPFTKSHSQKIKKKITKNTKSIYIDLKAEKSQNDEQETTPRSVTSEKSSVSKFEIKQKKFMEFIQEEQDESRKMKRTLKSVISQSIQSSQTYNIKESYISDDMDQSLVLYRPPLNESEIERMQLSLKKSSKGGNKIFEMSTAVCFNKENIDVNQLEKSLELGKDIFEKFREKSQNVNPFMVQMQVEKGDEFKSGQFPRPNYMEYSSNSMHGINDEADRTDESGFDGGLSLIEEESDPEFEGVFALNRRNFGSGREMEVSLRAGSEEF